MRTLRHTSNADDLVGCFGQDWRPGILVDHLHLLDPTKVRTLANGRPVAVASDGSVIDIVCGEIVWVFTEDGRIDGRCGRNVESNEAGACPAHTREGE